jgi:hypothetical protein
MQSTRVVISRSNAYTTSYAQLACLVEEGELRIFLWPWLLERGTIVIRETTGVPAARMKTASNLPNG